MAHTRFQLAIARLGLRQRLFQTNDPLLKRQHHVHQSHRIPFGDPDQLFTCKTVPMKNVHILMDRLLPNPFQITSSLRRDLASYGELSCYVGLIRVH